MPRFIKNGPIVPDQLVQELEEDRVIIFCGAGISAGGGLPGFRQLVEYCYTELGAEMPPAKDPAWLWLDRMLGALEGDFPDQMRAKVVEALDKNATDLAMHEAILKLARLKGSSDGYRLVTTNFDLFFEQANPKLALGVDYHSGPVVPIPRNDRIASWRSIVYLHGRLNSGSSDNQHLVLTSADFGRAYLTDAWAARFVARLFSEFTVLFIGYSLNDPVLRYMTDAFAAEDALTRSGRKRSPAYIFVPYKGRGGPPDAKLWRQRRLEPIFYREAYRHRALKNTLVEWAKARGDYLASVSTIVRRYGPRFPSALEPSYAANLVWAVCERPDDAGHGARVFAQLPDLPPIEWLAEFERRDIEARAEHVEEVRIANKEAREPAAAPAYHIDILFPEASEALRDGSINHTAFWLIHWLCRHLENEQLVNWVIAKLRHGRRAHPRLRWFIRRQLDGAPPVAAGFATFWRLVASEGDWASDAIQARGWIDLNENLAQNRHFGWFDRELASAMRPHLELAPSYRGSSGQAVDPAKFSTIADVEVALAYDDVSDLIQALDAQPDSERYWADRLDWLTIILRQVFDLYATVGEAHAGFDPSTLQRPSILPHAQNRNHAKWAQVYDLIWRGWSAVDAASPQASRHWIERWRQIPYLGFRRLALAAVTQSAHFTPDEKLEALLNG